MGHGCEKCIPIFVYIIYTYTHLAFYHISFVIPFHHLQVKHTSSVFAGSVLPWQRLGSQPTTAAGRCCEVVVTCQMIVTSHGGSPMSFIERRGNHRGLHVLPGCWQICCSTMVFMWFLHDLNMMDTIVDFWCGSPFSGVACDPALCFFDSWICCILKICCMKVEYGGNMVLNAGKVGYLYTNLTEQIICY